MVLLGNGLLALKAEIFIQFLIFSFTDHTDLLGVCHVQAVTLHSPRRYQEQSEGSFIEGGSHTMSKRLPLDTHFVGWFDRTRQSSQYNTIQYNTLFNHATFRSEKRSLKHVRAKTMYTINTIQYIQFIKNIYN